MRGSMAKRGFTLIEVLILFVIFLIVAFLVAPLSLDDTLQAKNTSKWRNIQSDFANLFYTMNYDQTEKNEPYTELINSVIASEVKKEIEPYKITFLNGTYPSVTYRFSDFRQTNANAVLALKFFDTPQDDGKLGMLLYDINGIERPNSWGRDVFGYNLYSNRFEPFCKDKSISEQKQDCSKNGTGLCCSNYYLIGGSFD